MFRPTPTALGRIPRRRLLEGAGAGALLSMATLAANSPLAPASHTGLVADLFCSEHITGAGHPERPERMLTVWEKLRASPVWARLRLIEPRPATVEEIQLCHSTRYVSLVEREVSSGYASLSTGDTAISARSFDVALRAAGSVLAMVDAVMSGALRNGFCLVRPPGHHASASRGMGFCLFNNVAVAARYAQKRWGAERVLIADWDVHHGNGTQDIFYEDGSVFVFNTHQSPWYPGTGATHETGAGAGKGATLNCPFPAGAGREEILGAFEDELKPAADRFQPDLILISAGFDSRVGDPLGRFRLTDRDFADLTLLMLELADRHCRGRLAAVLEGGYHLAGLASAVLAHVGALAGAAAAQAGA